MQDIITLVKAATIITITFIPITNTILLLYCYTITIATITPTIIPTAITTVQLSFLYNTIVTWLLEILSFNILLRLIFY